MININFYLDTKSDKNGLYPIHLVGRQKDLKFKVSIGEKIKKRDWDTKKQRIKESNPNQIYINKFLLFIETETEKFTNNPLKGKLTVKSVKTFVEKLVEQRKANHPVMINEDPDYLKGKKGITFIDLFAGAGGFSEGFLQAEYANKYYDFLLASDINENCELTHLARYNYQLGLDMEFIKQDISEPDFIDNLVRKLKRKNVDVVCGGPPCQSFSLAGKRKKFDKKDDLFYNYLNVIKNLRPKYFVMENVKGILTKEEGKIKDMIIQQIRSILDVEELHKLVQFISELRKSNKKDDFVLKCYQWRMRFENTHDKQLATLKDEYIKELDNKFRLLTPKIVDYKTSKTDFNISTIRHGFNLLKRSDELLAIRKKIIAEKAFSDLDNDAYVYSFDQFLTEIQSENIIERITTAFKNLKPSKEFTGEVADIISALEIYDHTFDECVTGLSGYIKTEKQKKEFNTILNEIRLYQIDKPFVALASNYGVPQNRERVLFIGCRKDQKLITNIPATVKPNEKVTVFEALYDLDFIGNDDEKYDYEAVNLKSKYNGTTESMKKLIRQREIDGKVDADNSKTYAEWSKIGRLNGRFKHSQNPIYVRNHEELSNQSAHLVANLHNHKTSKQNEDVIKRLELILKTGDYDTAKKLLKKNGLDSEKRNYNVLKADSQSPTVMTIPDDYIHFSSPRSLTVREMARLQSFDDSFVFQGKRSTGGNKRKTEVPQFTLVGNAVPPLMARAVAMEVLKNID